MVLDGATLSDQELQSLTNTISAAAGIDQTRGDVLNVVSIPFDKTTVEADQQAAADAQRMDLIYNVLKAVGPVAGALAVLFFLRTLLKRATEGQSYASRILVEGENPRLQGATAGALGALGMPGDAAHAQPALEPLADPFKGDQHRQLLIEQIESMAKANPKTLARVMQNWIDDERRA